MRKLWLLFAQSATIGLALWFVVTTLQPGWLTLPHGLHKPVETSAHEAKGAELPASRDIAVLSYNEGARKAGPAVVNIFTSKQARAANHPFADDPVFRHFFGEQPQLGRQPSVSLGSGVIVSRSGYILTNNHVVEAADQIEVALPDGRKAEAQVIGADPETDLAVLKIALPTLPAISFGKAEQLRVGDAVLAIGNPFGVGQTVTMGIISALGRNHLGLNTFENFIQTDAAINPGNSGGALVDAAGNLIGINTAIYSRSGGSMGIGFAIPVSTARQVMDQLISAGTVTRGYIGIEPQDVTPELAEAFGLPRRDGVIVAGVVRGGPAALAGLKTGDIVIAINGESLSDTPTMLNRIAQLAPGTQAKLTVLRARREMQINVRIAKRPRPSVPNESAESGEPDEPDSP